MPPPSICVVKALRLSRYVASSYAEALRGYHLHPEAKFLDGDYMDRGRTRRRHVLAKTIEDIGKEADKWDGEDPLSVDKEFTVSYGVSGLDSASMLTANRSVSKRSLAKAAKVSNAVDSVG
jgi:hypothetical protein